MDKQDTTKETLEERMRTFYPFEGGISELKLPTREIPQEPYSLPAIYAVAN